jgi:hypothetical protein
MNAKCSWCGAKKREYELKRGWTNALYCSAWCERASVSKLHSSMPGAGRLPRANWVPLHIAREISTRWQEAEEAAERNSE